MCWRALKHAGCVCSIDQVSVADVERAVQDKMNDAILHTLLSLFRFSYPTFSLQHSHFLNLHIAAKGFYLKTTASITHPMLFRVLDFVFV